MRPSTLAEMAEGYGMVVPETSGYGDFPAFSEMYKAAATVIKTADDLARVVSEVVEDAAVDGAVWIEPSFQPRMHAPTFGSIEAVIDIIVGAAADAADRFGIGVGLMVAGDRTEVPENAAANARFAVKYADRGVVSFGLASDEAVGPPEWFVDAFDIAREGGLLSAPHAGELAGPESIIAALDTLGADRLQHGVRAVEDLELLARLASSNVCLDVCPSSNVMLRVAASYADHPLPQLLDAGVTCSVNADDSLLFGPGLLDEYELCRGEFGFDDERMAAIAASSIEASGASDELKAASLASVHDWLNEPGPS
jgi:adenosine deaminase